MTGQMIIKKTVRIPKPIPVPTPKPRYRVVKKMVRIPKPETLTSDRFTIIK